MTYNRRGYGWIYDARAEIIALVSTLPEADIVYRHKNLSAWVIGQFEELLNKLERGGDVPSSAYRQMLLAFPKHLDVIVVFESGFEVRVGSC
jgi:hypothetical protein